MGDWNNDSALTVVLSFEFRGKGPVLDQLDLRLCTEAPAHRLLGSWDCILQETEELGWFEGEKS